jgi:hypothetical protein
MLQVDATTVRLRNLSPLPERGDGLTDIATLHEGRPIDAIALLLQDKTRVRPLFRNRIHVVVGSPWVQAAVLPWQPGLFSEAAWKTYAGALIAKRTNRLDWDVAVETGRYGASRLGIALCPDLIMSIKEVCAATGWRLGTLSDMLTTSVFHHVAILKEPEYCFMLAEPEAFTCLYRDQQGWRDLITLPRTQHGLDAWSATGSLLSNQPLPKKIYVCGVDLPEIENGSSAFQILDAWYGDITEKKIQGEVS